MPLNVQWATIGSARLPRTTKKRMESKEKLHWLRPYCIVALMETNYVQHEMDVSDDSQARLAVKAAHAPEATLMA